MFSGLTTILTVAIVVQIRNKGLDEVKSLYTDCAAVRFLYSLKFYLLSITYECYCVVQVFKPSPSRLLLMPDAAFGRDQIPPKGGFFLAGSRQ